MFTANDIINLKSSLSPGKLEPTYSIAIEGRDKMPGQMNPLLKITQKF